MPNTVFEQRVRAAWRARAAAAGLSCGAMIFCAGAGIAVPVSLNAAALSALSALALSALVAIRAQRILRRPVEKTGALPRVLFAILSLTLALSCTYIAAAQVNLAERTLLTQARVGWISAVTLAGVGFLALSGGTALSRACFSVRRVLPVLLVLLGAKALKRGKLVGLFPVLGAGAGPLALSSLCMLCAAAPVLLLLCPSDEEDGGSALVPPARFFVLRVLVGGGVGAILLLSLVLCNTYDTLIFRTNWGERMMVTCAHEPRLGVLQMALILTQMLGLVLASASLLCGAERAAAKAAQRPGKNQKASRWPFFGCFGLTLVALFSMQQIGYNRALYVAPALIAPVLLLLLLGGGLRAKKKEEIAK